MNIRDCQRAGVRAVSNLAKLLGRRKQTDFWPYFRFTNVFTQIFVIFEHLNFILPNFNGYESSIGT